MAVNPIQQILQMLLMGMPQGGAVGPVPRMGSTDSESEATADEALEAMTPSDEEPRYLDMSGAPREDLAPFREDAPNGLPMRSTEEELEGVHREIMGKGRDYAAEIMEALQANDDATVDLLLSEMRDNGINIDTLPPDIQDQLIEMDMHPGYDDGLKE